MHRKKRLFRVVLATNDEEMRVQSVDIGRKQVGVAERHQQGQESRLRDAFSKGSQTPRFLGQTGHTHRDELDLDPSPPVAGRAVRLPSARSLAPPRASTHLRLLSKMKPSMPVHAAIQSNSHSSQTKRER